jgi:hypothetical protein
LFQNIIISLSNKTKQSEGASPKKAGNGMQWYSFGHMIERSWVQFLAESLLDFPIVKFK